MPFNIFMLNLSNSIIICLIIYFVIILYPHHSYPYLEFNYYLEEKNNNSELLNKIIEPSINYVSLKNEIDIDIDDDEIEIDIGNNFHKDRHYDDFHFDYDDDIDIYDIDDIDIYDIDDLDMVCFENDDDDDTLCFNDGDIDIDDINNHDVIFLDD